MKIHLTETQDIKSHPNSTVTFPRLAFAFNPITVEVVTPDINTFVTIVVRDNSKPESDTVSIVRDSLNEHVTFDLSAIARSVFDRTRFHKSTNVFEDAELYKTLACTVYIGANSPTSFNIPVIWGAMQIGETYSQSRTLKMFRGYPFTVPFLLSYLNSPTDIDESAKAKLLVQIDGRAFVEKKKEMKEGKFNFTVDSDPQKRLTLWIENGGHDKFVTTFDYTFDYTFRGLSETSFVMHVDVLDTCTSDRGYYLRWINSHGEYCYWMFKPQVESSVVENLGIEFDQYYTTVNFSDNYHVGTNKSVGKKIKKSIQLYADFVDSADFNFLMGLVQSPVVDLYMGQTDGVDKWMSVNIQPATFPKGKEHLQDFSFIMELPQTQIQSL